MKTTLFPYVENYQIFYLTSLYPNMARLFILLIHLFIHYQELDNEPNNIYNKL